MPAVRPNKDTRIYALIGNPVAHSRSPFIMNRAFAAIGADASYLALPVPPRDLGATLDGLSLLSAPGANVTYPYKEAVAQRLEGALSDDAALLGAVNTLVWRDGDVRGHNTDAPGVAAALADIAGVDAEGARVFIFGAGGSARAAALGLLRVGAASVTLGARSPERARAALSPLAGAFADRAPRVVGLGDQDRDTRADAVTRAGIVINATPVGMAGGDAQQTLVDDDAWIGADQCWFDFVYHPRRTAFLERAGARGATTVDGLALLVAQASASFELWTGKRFDTAGMLSALEEEGIA